MDQLRQEGLATGLSKLDKAGLEHAKLMLELEQAKETYLRERIQQRLQQLPSVTIHELSCNITQK